MIDARRRAGRRETWWAALAVCGALGPAAGCASFSSEKADLPLSTADLEGDEAWARVQASGGSVENTVWNWAGSDLDKFYEFGEHGIGREILPYEWWSSWNFFVWTQDGTRVDLDNFVYVGGEKQAEKHERFELDAARRTLQARTGTQSAYELHHVTRANDLVPHLLERSASGWVGGKNRADVLALLTARGVDLERYGDRVSAAEREAAKAAVAAGAFGANHAEWVARRAAAAEAEAKAKAQASAPPPAPAAAPAPAPAPAGPPASLAEREAAVKAHPDDVAAWVAVAEGRLGAEDFPGTLAACDRIAALEPKNPDAPNFRASVLLLTGKPAEARPLFEAVVRRAPWSPVPRWYLAEAQILAGDSAAGRATLRGALERIDDPGTLGALTSDARTAAAKVPATGPALVAEVDAAGAAWRADDAASGEVHTAEGAVGAAFGRNDKAAIVDALARLDAAERKTPIVQLRRTSMALVEAAKQALWAGRYERSLELFQRVLPELDATRMNPSERGEVLNYAGQPALRLRRFDVARAYYEEALSLGRADGSAAVEGGAESGLGGLYTILGDLPRATPHLEASLAANRKGLAAARGPEAVAAAEKELSSALSNVGTTHHQLGRLKSARALYEEALALDTKLGVDTGRAASLELLGLVSFGLREYERAEREYTQARALYTQKGLAREAAKVTYALGKVRLYRGDVAGAEKLYREALAALRRDGSPFELIDTLSALGGALHQQRRFREAQAPFEEAVALQEQLRAKLGAEERRNLLAGQYQTYRLLAENHFHLGEHAAALRAFERARGRTLAEQLSGRAEPAAPDLDALGRSLPEGTALVYYGLYRNPQLFDTMGIYLFVLTRDGLRAQYDTDTAFAARWRGTRKQAAEALEGRDRGFKATFSAGSPTQTPPAGAGEPAALAGGAPGAGAGAATGPSQWPSTTLTEDAIEWYRMLLQSPSGASNPAAAELSRGLYDVFVAPALALAGGEGKVRELVIVPDGALAFLPFDTLTGPSGRPLVATTAVRLAPSATVLDLVARRTHGAGRSPLLAWGDPRYEALKAEPAADVSESAMVALIDGLRARGESLRPAYAALGIGAWSPLPGTRKEVEAIARVVPGTETRYGAEANEARLKADARAGTLGRYRALHFATHGFVSPLVPELSAVVLAQRAGDPEDGFLTGPEIAALPLKADFVALSACETGLGRTVNGEGVVGLTQAFLLAGANGVAASLWPVPDEETAKLMTEVYRAVAGGASYRDALTQAKRRAQAGELGAALKAPVVWGAFSYYGQ